MRGPQLLWQIYQLKVVTSALQAAHLGTQYLTHNSFTDSTFGQVLLLRHVCWLDINAKFHVGALFHYSLWKVPCCAADAAATTGLLDVGSYVCMYVGCLARGVPGCLEDDEGRHT